MRRLVAIVAAAVMMSTMLVIAPGAAFGRAAIVEGAPHRAQVEEVTCFVNDGQIVFCFGRTILVPFGHLL